MPAAKRRRYTGPAKHIIDQEGDVILRIPFEGTTTNMQVCSKTLAKGGHFFDKLLFGPYIESRGRHRSEDEQWVVVIEELQPTLLVGILHFLHHGDPIHMRGLSGLELYDAIRMVDYLCCDMVFREVAMIWQTTTAYAIEHVTNTHDIIDDGLLAAARWLGMEDLALATLNKLQKEANDIHSDLYDLCSRAAHRNKSVDDQLRFADGKEMNLEQELAQFDFPATLKRNRDILWVKESDAKEKGLELYADADVLLLA